MAKYEVEMELTGFRLKIRGDREDLPVITTNIHDQIAGLIEPAVNIAQGRLPAAAESPHVEPQIVGPLKAKRRSKRSAPSGNGEQASSALELQPDPAKWGVPKQAWKAWEKIVWLMFIAKSQGKAEEMSASAIVNTFNKHFKSAGQLFTNSMPRDLANLKQRSPAVISDDANKKPIVWFLTDEGMKIATKLVADAKGNSPAET